MKKLTRQATRLAWVAMALMIFRAAAGQQLEQSVKAAYLYNFTKYVNWPAGSFDSPSSPIVIGVVGEDSLGGALDSVVKDKTVDGRRIVVKHLRWNQDLAECQVLFVPAGAMADASQLEHLKRKPVLTVGESAGFARKHGIVNFVLESNRVRFEINANAARECGLSISSKLLTLGIPPN